MDSDASRKEVKCSRIDTSAQVALSSTTETRTKTRTTETSGRTRREFNWLMLAWTAFTTATAAGLAATFRFMFPNVLFGGCF
jgi:hypothetical protein